MSAEARDAARTYLVLIPRRSKLVLVVRMSPDGRCLFARGLLPDLFLQLKMTYETGEEQWERARSPKSRACTVDG